MDLHTISTFIKVSEHLNITRAAEELFLSQPAVTKQIKALEAEMGATLLIRGARQLTLSPAGEKVLPLLKQVLELLALARDSAREITSPGKGHLLVAAGTAIMCYVLPDVLAAFKLEFPEAEVTVFSGKTTEVVRMIDEGTAQVGLVTSEVSHKSLVVEPLFWDVLGVVAAPHLRTVRKLPELAREPWLLFARGTGFRTFLDSVFVVEGMAPRVVMELESVEALKAMAVIGLGYTILPLKAVEEQLKKGSLIHIPLENKVPLVRRNSLVYRKETNSLLAQSFIRLAKEHLQKA